MRIGIVNDLTLACRALAHCVEQGGHHVAWTAADGQQAVDLAQSDPADLILMDLIMPVKDGVQATREIMQKAPCPILVVTVSVGDNIHFVYEAMGFGALDAVNTPSLTDPDSVAALLAKIKTIGRLAHPAAPSRKAPAKPKRTSPPADGVPLILIGASTGGPHALATILKKLPADLPAAVCIVQHIDANFAPGLVTWLDEHSQLPVTMARAGDCPHRRHVYFAGGDEHLVLGQGGRFEYTEDPVACPYRPSVDALFHSVAKHWPTPGQAALLTGMGSDGAVGLLALRDRGWTTYAQDEDSCIVYGMPRAAVALDAATRVLPLANLSPALTRTILETS